MSKKIGEDGLEYFDGSVVDEYKGRISNTFEMENEDGVILSDGDFVTLTVQAEVGSPTFAREKKSGRLRRVNKFTAVEVSIVRTAHEETIKVEEDDLWTLAEPQAKTTQSTETS